MLIKVTQHQSSRAVPDFAVLQPPRTGVAVKARNHAGNKKLRRIGACGCRSGQGPGHRGRQKDTAKFEDNGCQGIAPAARDKAVAASTEANAAADDEVKV